MTFDARTITLLRAGYRATFRRPLEDRVAELRERYPDSDDLCSELGALMETQGARDALADALADAPVWDASQPLHLDRKGS